MATDVNHFILLTASLFCVSQLMQQQAAIMAASHGGYLAPSMAFPATQIHQVGAINMNGLPPTPMTPVSGQLESLLHIYTSY